MKEIERKKVKENRGTRKFIASKVIFYIRASQESNQKTENNDRSKKGDGLL